MQILNRLISRMKRFLYVALVHGSSNGIEKNARLKRTRSMVKGKPMRNFNIHRNLYRGFPKTTKPRVRGLEA